MPTLSIFSDMSTGPHWMLNQCERYEPQRDPLVAYEGDWRVISGQRDADVVLCVNMPVWPKGIGLMPWWRRLLTRATGRYYQVKVRQAMAWLNVPRNRTYLLMYEPPPFAEYYRTRVGDHVAGAWAPDPRWVGKNQGVDRLPVWWTIADRTEALRAEPTPDDDAQRDLGLVVVTGGKSALPGHVARLDFLRLLRRAGVPIAIYGRGVPDDLGSLGPVTDKAEVLRRARFTLAIENFAQGDLYVSEKLWDPLLCWSMPIYFGSAAADAMIPADSFVRLPDLGDAGVEVVRRTLAEPALRNVSLSAIARARQQILGEARLVPWFLRRSGVAGPGKAVG